MNPAVRDGDDLIVALSARPVVTAPGEEWFVHISQMSVFMPGKT